MNVQEISTGTAARLLAVPSFVGSKTSGIHLIRALQERYSFLVAPSKLEDFDPQKGIAFHHGFLGGKHALVALELFSNGIRAESREGTEVADMFIDDVLGWLKIEAGLVVSDEGTLRIYNSVIVAEMSVRFAENFERFSAVGKLIGDSISAYGGPSDPYEMAGLMMWTSKQNQGPALFKIERRVDQPFTSNIYYSSAPLTTNDHKRALEALEKVMA